MADLAADLRRVQHAENGLGERGFAAAGFAHKAQDLAAPDLEAHIGESLKARLPAEKASVLIDDGELFDLEHIFNLIHGVSSWGWRQ